MLAKKRRRTVCWLLCGLLTFFCTNGLCEKLWDAHWNPGEYTIELTQSDVDELKALWEEIDRRSVGSNVREVEKMRLRISTKTTAKG